MDKKVRIETTQNPSVIVMKFGGSSLATTDLIAAAADRIRRKSRYFRTVVVVSAMGDDTDRLLELSQAFSATPNQAAVDTVLAAGEQIAAGLMAAALTNLGLKAQPFLAHQLPILTDGNFGNGHILQLETGPLVGALDAGVIPVVAGFQGIDRQRQLVTLGRGGSDTSAVVIAAALGAVLCELYKDVDGIYSSDPRRTIDAERFDRLTYGEMEAIAAREPQILHDKAVKLARQHHVRLHVRSAFTNAPGTIVALSKENEKMEEVSA